MTLQEQIKLIRKQEEQAWCMGWDTMARALREQRQELEKKESSR